MINNPNKIQFHIKCKIKLKVSINQPFKAVLLKSLCFFVVVSFSV